MQTRLQRRLKIISAETGEHGSITDGPEEVYIVDEVLPAASAGLSDNGIAAMTTFIKEMVPFFPMCDVIFCNFVEEHKMVAGEELYEKVDFILVNSPYNVRSDKEEVNTTHDVFAMEYMKDMSGAVFCDKL